ncbi:hypothetical protein TB2_017919 [Malus domestica]
MAQGMQIPNSAVSLDDKDHLFAKNFLFQLRVVNAREPLQACHQNQHDLRRSSRLSAFHLFSVIRRYPDEPIKSRSVNGLDYADAQSTRNLLEVSNANDILSVVNNLPLQWLSKKRRTTVGKPLTNLTLPLRIQQSKEHCSKEKETEGKKNVEIEMIVRVGRDRYKMP